MRHSAADDIRFSVTRFFRVWKEQSAPGEKQVDSLDCKDIRKREISPEGGVVLQIAQPRAREAVAAARVQALQDGEALQQRRQLRVPNAACRPAVRDHPPAHGVVKLYRSTTCTNHRGRALCVVGRPELLLHRL